MTPRSWSRLRGAAHGLILGEALGWTGLYQRSHLLPPWTRRKRREIESQHERDALLEVSLPFALNQPTAPFAPAPGPHAEWLAFQLTILRGNRGRYARAAALDAWRELVARRAELRLTIGQHAALENLARGKLPPFTGYDNPHHFDDAACFRAIPLAALMAPDPEALATCVGEDATITNARDGVWAAQAFAVAMAGAVASGDVAASLAAALARLPEDSWISHRTRLALEASASAGTLFELISHLSREVVNHAYNYGNSAAETVPITFAILDFTGGELHRSLLAALALPRTAGSVAPLAGALCGALDPDAAAAGSVFGTRLAGIGLPMFAGVDLIDLLDAAAAS